MNASVISQTGPEDLERIRVLWEALNAHHQALSPHFSGRFARLTFADRKADFLQKAASGQFFLFLAMLPDADVPRGYCAASLDAAGRGEIDSLYVDEAFRGRGLGQSLLRAALDAFAARDVPEIRINVAAGNESAFGFYARFGFAPAGTILLRLPPPGEP